MGANRQSTLCWNCNNAVTKGCSWAREFVPVDGWNAEETQDSYLVISCPKFVRDSPGRPELDTQACNDMIEKLLELTREDYIKGGTKIEEQIERFLRGHGAAKVHRIDNPEAVIRKLKADKKKFWEEQNNE